MLLAARMGPTGSIELVHMSGPNVWRTSRDYFPVFRSEDGNLREFVLVRTCLGHTCPWVSLERVGRQ
eukprot:4232925-Alexandrium_andersonii.AAC.1